MQYHSLVDVGIYLFRKEQQFFYPLNHFNSFLCRRHSANLTMLDGENKCIVSVRDISLP